eukprot:gene17416-22966_t
MYSNGLPEKDTIKGTNDMFPLFEMNKPTINDNRNLEILSVLSLVSMFAFMYPDAANAIGGEYGLFEKKAASLLHPITMLLLFGTSFYSGVLGLKWRRLREIPTEIKSLSEGLPKISTGKVSSPLSTTISAIKSDLVALEGSEDNDTPSKVASLKNDLAVLTSALDLDSKIIELTNERKSLIGDNLRDKHWLTGSVLLGVGVTVSILGAFNTYLRTGKLFPGPHLYAGMAVTILWAVAASLVPAMQKGDEKARSAHIALNSINVALFAWQVVTGFDILAKVWEKAPW